MTTHTRRGLTLVEMLAALALLSLVAGACVSWITSVSRSSVPTLDARLDSTDLDRAILFIEELTLRSTDGRTARVDQQGELLVPTRWWVAVPSGELELATWVRIQHDPAHDHLAVAFTDDQQRPLGEPRVVIHQITDATAEQVRLPDEPDQVRFTIAATNSEARVIVLPAEELP